MLKLERKTKIITAGKPKPKLNLTTYKNKERKFLQNFITLVNC